jgi:hypothetical protein
MRGARWAGWLTAAVAGCGGSHEGPSSGAPADAEPMDQMSPDPTAASDASGTLSDAPTPLADAAGPQETAEGDAAGDVEGPPETDGSIDAAGPALEPLRVAFTWHLEGAQLVRDRASFDRYVADLRTFSDLFAAYGAVPTWEAAEVVEKSVTYGVNILKELEDRGDAIGLHANGVGYVGADPDYTFSDMVTELTRQTRQIRALGVTVRHVSNICSAVDWVRATREAGLEAATAMVDYCLKSLINPGEAAGCSNPSQCHDAWPGTVTGQMSAWHARSGADWTTPVAPGDDTVLLIPTAGSVNCASEAASGTVSPTRCAYDAADVDAVLAELEATLAARVPGLRHSFVMVASWGTRPDETVLRALFEAIRTRWVTSGDVRWVGYDTLLDDLRAAPPRP